ncbi:MAG: DUF1259 domain-containing protein [Deltaproteobacteria bacterium]
MYTGYTSASDQRQMAAPRRSSGRVVPMSMSQSSRQRAVLLLALGLPACSQHKEPPVSAPTPASAAAPSAPTVAAPLSLDAPLIGERVGAAPLALPGGALSLTLPRSGVTLSVEGRPVPGALNTELLFRPAADGATLSGSVELLEDEVSPVIDTLLAHGIRIAGLYNRFLYDEPRVLVLRLEGHGNPLLLASGAQSISSVLRDARLRSAKPLRELPGDAPDTGKLDAAALGGTLGVVASENNGAVSLEVPRPPEAAREDCATPAPGGPWLRASFSGSDLHAALSGTLLLCAPELARTLAALRTANVHLVGLVPQDQQGDAGWRRSGHPHLEPEPPPAGHHRYHRHGPSGLSGLADDRTADAALVTRAAVSAKERAWRTEPLRYGRGGLCLDG